MQIIIYNPTKRQGEIDNLATVDGHIVAARQGKQLVTAFHPELNDSLEIHRYFCRMIEESTLNQQAS